jgi:hypothetical protein
MAIIPKMTAAERMANREKFNVAISDAKWAAKVEAASVVNAPGEMGLTIINNHEVAVPVRVLESNRAALAERKADDTEYRRLAALGIYAEDKAAKQKRGPLSDASKTPPKPTPKPKRPRGRPRRPAVAPRDPSRTGADTVRVNYATEGFDPEVRGQYRLWLAVLDKAITDATIKLKPARVHGHNASCPRRCKRLRLTANHAAQLSALEWFDSSESEWTPKTFLWVARILDLDPQTIRERVRSIRNERVAA